MYARVFEVIYDSSIAEDWQLRVVFQDFLILADSDGIVNRTPESISRRTNVPLELVLAKIKILEAPDPRSNTPDNEGRRIALLDPAKPWGWRILNWERWREIRTREQLKEQNRIRVQRWRDKQAGNGTPEPVEAKKRASTFVKPEKSEWLAHGEVLGMPAIECEKAWDFYESNGWKVGRNPMRDWSAAMRNWKRNMRVVKPNPNQPDPATGFRPLPPGQNRLGATHMTSL